MAQLKDSVVMGNLRITDVVLAGEFTGSGAEITDIDAGNITTGTIAAARLPAASTTTQGAMSATDKSKLDGITNMTGATSSAAGKAGLVPAPAAGAQGKFLRGDGTWQTPTDNNTDTKVNVTLATTSKAFVLGTTTTPTSTAAGVTAVADTGVYLDTTAGKLTATSFAGNGASLTSLNASNLGSGTVPAARLPAASTSAQGAMSAADKTKLDGIAVMTAATSSAAGTQGLVPAPAAGNQGKFLRGDGTWQTPTDTNTDTKVNVTLGTTTKAFVLGTSTTPTSTATGVTAIADTGVYLDTTAGKLTATSFAGNGASLTSLNASNLGSGTVPAARLPAATTSAQGAMSAADKTKLDKIVVMQGATSSTGGESGLVPAPTAGNQGKFLRGDGTWQTPIDTNTDTKVNVTLGTTSKAFLLGTTTTPTSTAAAVTTIADTGVYLDTTAGKLTATSFAGNGASLTSLNASNLGSGTVPAARLPAASTSAQGAMSAADKSKLDGIDMSTKADKSDTVLSTTLSRGRRSGSTVGTRSFAFGNDVVASGTDAHSEGSQTVAFGEDSHAEGLNSVAYGAHSHAEGYSATVSLSATGSANSTTYTITGTSAGGSARVGAIVRYGEVVAKINSSTVNSATNVTVVLDKTLSSSALSNATCTIVSGAATGQDSHVEGQGTIATGAQAHAEGALTVASGNGSHAEGSSARATGAGSHAEGSSSSATGANSHAEGASNTASGARSHAEGYLTKASGDNSHAEGYNTTANHANQHTEGQFNILDPSTAAATAKGNYIHIAGNGTSTSARSNAYTLDWSGNAEYAGDVEANACGGANPVSLVNTAAALNALSSVVDVGNKITLSASGMTLAQKTAYAAGHQVSLTFSVTNTAALSAGTAYTITVTYTDAGLKPAHLSMVFPGTSACGHGAYIGSSTGNTASIVFVPTTNIAVNSAWWMYTDYMAADAASVVLAANGVSF